MPGIVPGRNDVYCVKELFDVIIPLDMDEILEA